MHAACRLVYIMLLRSSSNGHFLRKTVWQFSSHSYFARAFVRNDTGTKPTGLDTTRTHRSFRQTWHQHLSALMHQRPAESCLGGAGGCHVPRGGWIGVKIMCGVRVGWVGFMCGDAGGSGWG